MEKKYRIIHKEDMHDFCEYVRRLISSAEVLAANEYSSVCTNTQCFADWDALVPMHAPSSSTLSSDWVAIVAVMFMAMLMILGTTQRPFDLTNKRFGDAITYTRENDRNR